MVPFVTIFTELYEQLRVCNRKRADSKSSLLTSQIFVNAKKNFSRSLSLVKIVIRETQVNDFVPLILNFADFDTVDQSSKPAPNTIIKIL